MTVSTAAHQASMLSPSPRRAKDRRLLAQSKGIGYAGLLGFVPTQWA